MERWSDLRERLTNWVKTFWRQIGGRPFLQDEAESFRLLFDNNPMPMWVYERKTYRILAVNEAAIDHYGFSRETFLNMSIKNLRPPEEVAELVDYVASAPNARHHSGLWRHRKRDGSDFFVEIMSQPIVFKGSKARLVLAKDVTTRHRYEEDLHRSEVRYRRLFEGSPISLWEEDFSAVKAEIDRLREEEDVEDFRAYFRANPHKVKELVSTVRVLDVNARSVELFNASGKEQLLGPYKLRDENLLESFRQEFVAIAEGRTFLEVETPSATIGGREIVMAVTWSVDSRHADTYESVLVSIVDITELKQVQQELEQSRQQLRDLAAYLQSAREEERTRIAREIHDEFGQVLTALKMDVTWMRQRLPEGQPDLEGKMQDMIDLIDETVQMVRRIATELRPGLLDDLGLVAAIEWQAQEFTKRSGVPCTLNVEAPEVPLDRELTTALFRIFQETLTNVARHAQATRVTVTLAQRESSLVLIVEDDGKGISSEEIEGRESLGLVGMRERALGLGGSLTLEGTPNEGTTVTVRIPLNHARGDSDDKSARGR